MKKLNPLNKTLSYKILSALPVIGVYLTTTYQTSNAMFKNSLEFFKKLEKSYSGAPSPITKPLTSLTQKTGGSSILSGSSKLPVQTSSSLSTAPKTTTSTTTKHTSSQTSIGSTDYKTTLTNLIEEGSSKILQSLYEIHTSDGKNKTKLTTEVKNLKANVISLSKRNYQDKFKKHYPNENELRTNALIFGNSIADYVFDEIDPKVNLFIDYIVTENNPIKVQQTIKQLSNELGDYIGPRANNELRVRLLAFE